RARAGSARARAGAPLCAATAGAGGATVLDGARALRAAGASAGVGVGARRAARLRRRPGGARAVRAQPLAAHDLQHQPGLLVDGDGGAVLPRLPVARARDRALRDRARGRGLAGAGAGLAGGGGGVLRTDGGELHDLPGVAARLLRTPLVRVDPRLLARR